MRLSVTDRWILSNQYQILEHLDPGGAEQYQRAREALESGYELEYDAISSHVFKDGSTLSEEACDEVIDVLDMFRALGRSYDELEDKAGIEERRIRFQGFDGNNETEQLAYSRYLVRTDRFTELVGAYGLNSHHPTLPLYRRMVREWKASKQKYELTKEDIERIVRAGWAHRDEEAQAPLPGR